ncbi:MAG: CPBP family intramembrane metalloprotease [Pseudomonadota bacterium]|nr:CPBP family intramembrane metalloprotease [Pseudomonadota bacterium]
MANNTQFSTSGECWRDMEPQSWAAWQAPTFLKTLSYMGGPAIAAAICLLLFRRSHDRTITLAGSSAVRSAAFYLIPIIALALVYAPEVVAARGAPALILSLIAGSFILILGEELGWRGFLQDALRRLPKLSRYALIGVMWELWHFTNRTHEGPLVGAAIRVLIWMVILFILSWIIGEAVERSKSVVVAVTLHAWVNILASMGSIFDASPTRGYAIFAASILLWLYLLRSWPTSAATHLPGKFSSSEPPPRSVPPRSLSSRL